MTERKIYGAGFGPYLYDDTDLVGDPDDEFDNFTAHASESNGGHIIAFADFLDTDQSHGLKLYWNENDAAHRELALLVGGGNRSLTIESDAIVSQDYSVDAAPTFGGLTKVGTASNYTTIEADGTIKFTGDATVFKDINMGSAQLGQPASGAPTEEKFFDEAGGDTGIYALAFAVGEYVSGSFELQHDYKEGSNVTFHVHWQGKAAPAGGTDNVKWQLEYTVAQQGQTLNATTTIVIETAYTTQYQLVRSDFPAIDGTNFDIGDQFLFKLSRIAASADEYGGEAFLTTCGLHYEIDTIGSRQIVTK